MLNSYRCSSSTNITHRRTNNILFFLQFRQDQARIGKRERERERQTGHLINAYMFFVLVFKTHT